MNFQEINKKGPLELRAHHGMCLAYFEGRGYSQGFTAHMQSVLDAMGHNPSLKLVTGGDIVCSRCPNLSEGVCATAEKVLSYDKAVLSLTGLREGDVLSWSEFSALVKSKILTTGNREHICGNCEWNEICKAREDRPNF